MTLAAAWMIGEYGDVLIEGGVISEEQTSPVCVLYLSANEYN